MADGPTHYRAAEGCMDAAERFVQANNGKRVPQHEAEALRADVAGTLAAAQVHAVLALAAAMAEIDYFGGDAGTGRRDDRAQAWNSAFGVSK